MRHRLIRIILLLLVLIVLLYGNGPLRLQEEWHRIAQPYKFSLVGWEAKHFLDKWRYRVQGFLQGRPQDGQALVEAYFSLVASVREAEAQLLQLRATGGPGQGAQESRLGQLRAEKDRLEAEVEEDLEAQLSQVIQEEGLTMTLDLGFRGSYLFPPVDFKFERLPHLLIISPRGVIQTRDTVLLTPELSLSQMEDIEARVEELDVSAYVASIGGFSTYPSLIPETASLEEALSTAAHEWLHAYLFFKPLGSRYQESQEMRTINETVADMAGRELASRLLVRYGRAPLPAPAPPEAAPGPEDETIFDFNREMRRIRLEVDRLLGEGQVEAAERYMEEQRRLLADHGHYLRKLNQAYFAFHGSYADSPASASPIGGQLAELRRRSGSLREFVQAVAQISGYQDLLALLEASP